MNIALLGDVGLFGRFDLKNNPHVKKYFNDVSRVLSRYDYVVCNLETPFTTTERTSVCKSAHLKSNPINVELLKLLHVNAVNLANNHIFDFGIRGFMDTISTLESVGIEYFGINDKQLFLENDKIVFSGYCCYSTNGAFYLTSQKKKGVNILDPTSIKSNIKENKSKGFFNICSMHFGDEHTHFPRLDHINLARDIAKDNEYVLYGHHPHVIQGLETYSGSLLAYSLGNFCFDDVYDIKTKSLIHKRSLPNRESLILSINIEKGHLQNYQVIPLLDTGNSISVVPAGSESFDKIHQYSSYFEMDSAKYKNFRNKDIFENLKYKKQSRSIKWYFKRMSINLIGTKIKGLIFKKRYSKKMNKYL